MIIGKKFDKKHFHNSTFASVFTRRTIVDLMLTRWNRSSQIQTQFARFLCCSCLNSSFTDEVVQLPCVWVRLKYFMRLGTLKMERITSNNNDHRTLLLYLLVYKCTVILDHYVLLMENRRSKFGLMTLSYHCSLSIDWITQYA